MDVHGILLLYHRPLEAMAPTIREHVKALVEQSQFRVFAVNTEYGFPKALKRLRFNIVLLHYSLFGWYPFALGKEFVDYLQSNPSAYKIAFFQDEYRLWPQRVQLIDCCKIQCIYTLVEPRHFAVTYGKYVPQCRLFHTLPGYVSRRLVRYADRFAASERHIDIGYRGRELSFCLGRGAQEKRRIAEEFKARARHLPLKLDIETAEDKRIYGVDWYKFLASCRACLGVEAGASIFDIDHEVYPKYEQLMAAEPNLSFDDVFERLLAPYEDKIPYRTISPRHFEAAAFRVCQILFEGRYSGILKPMVHYIPLKKDFSNFDEVIRLFRNEALRRRICDNAYRDLIASEQFSYRRFVEEFDQHLFDIGLRPDCDESTARQATQLLETHKPYQRFKDTYGRLSRWLRDRRVFGRCAIRAVAKPLLRVYTSLA